VKTAKPYANLILLLSSMLTCLHPSAQQIGTNKTGGQPDTYTLSVKTQLVVETVVAKDKQGKFINGLTAKDFTVTEDGAPQTIRVFEHEKLPTTAEPLPPTPADEENIVIYHQLAKTQIKPEDPNRAQYKGRRLLVMYFDMTAMPYPDQVRALYAAEKFIREQMTASDLVSLMRYSGGSVDVLQDFSADRNKLLSVLQTLVVGEGQGSAVDIDDASSADTGSAFGQDDSEFNLFNTDRQLSALQTAAKMLASMNEKKVLLYFASGLRLNGIDNQAQLRATVDAAIRAGVSFWPVDARGLVATAPLGDATQGSAGNVGMYSGTAAQAVTDSFQQSQDTMYSLAADTGGKALFDNNDLTRGIVQAQQSISDYYIVGYYTTNTAMNGHFRKVKIIVNGPEVAKLEYREGYYASKQFGKFSAVEKERQLEDALMLGDPVTDLTIAVELNYFQLNRAEYFVPVMVKIPGSELALAKKFGAEHTLIDFIGEVKDDVTGATITNLRDSVNLKLDDTTAEGLSRRPIEYDAGFTLTPGRYSIKILARDAETGRIGTYQTQFVIPNLNKVVTRVPISSVVLSGQQVNIKDAIYNATRGKDAAKNDDANPLVQEGMKLIPSVTRVFSVDRELYVYLQGYLGNSFASANPSGSPAKAVTGPLVATVSFYQDGTKIMQMPAVVASALPGTSLGVVPLQFSISLAKLTPGRYECEVSVLDPAGQRAAFWVGSLLLVR
jgi:VWFA-related protein